MYYYMVYIAYIIELDLQICDYAQKQRICRENCKYVFDENIHGHFCPDERLPSSATMEYLISTCYDLIFVVPKVAGEGWLSGGKGFEGGVLHQPVYPNVDYQYQGECSLSV